MRLVVLRSLLATLLLQRSKIENEQEDDDEDDWRGAYTALTKHMLADRQGKSRFAKRTIS